MAKKNTSFQIEDYAKYSDESLSEAARTVNRLKYPYIWHQIHTEMQRRGHLDGPVETPHGESALQPVTDFVNPEDIVLELQKPEKVSSSLSWQNLAALGATIAAFAFFQRQLDLGSRVFYLILALLVHESGHILAMRFCNYKNLRILMIPFLGAVAIGNPTDKSAKKAAFIAVAGPLFGLLSAFIAAVIYRFIPEPALFEYARLAIYLNLFNLLPVRPLDGGAFLNETLFCRYPRAQIGFAVLSVALLFILSISQKWSLQLPLFLTWMIFIQTRTGYFSARLAMKLREKNSQSEEISTDHVLTVLQQYKKNTVGFAQINERKDKIQRWAKIVRTVWIERRRLL